jgi:hypothetical protein
MGATYIDMPETMFPQVELGKAEVFQQGDALHPFRNFI